jgi:hypothetical protein
MERGRGGEVSHVCPRPIQITHQVTPGAPAVFAPPLTDTLCCAGVRTLSGFDLFDVWLPQRGVEHDRSDPLGATGSVVLNGLERIARHFFPVPTNQPGDFLLDTIDDYSRHGTSVTTEEYK